MSNKQTKHPKPLDYTCTRHSAEQMLIKTKVLTLKVKNSNIYQTNIPNKYLTQPDASTVYDSSLRRKDEAVLKSFNNR